MKYLLPVTFLLSAIVVIASCLKQEYDAPPDQNNEDPQLTVTHTIAQLKALNGPYIANTGGDTSFFVQDIVVCGIVTANDRSGNFYKQLIIQDNTAAIMILADANNLYAEYPTGRKLYIKCRGLWLGYDGGLPVLGYTPDEQLSPTAIPGARFRDHLIKANIGNTVRPDTVDLRFITDTVRPELYNRLLWVREAQFTDTTLTYAQPNSTTNRDLEDCSAATLAVRTSNYASFASLYLPAGKGSICGIYTVYINSSDRKTPQLLIRDTGDVRFSSPRCGVVTGKVLMKQNFTGIATGTLILNGWTNFAEAGTKLYSVDSFGGTKFAKISGYSSGQASVKTWLITPAVDLGTVNNPSLIFKTIDGYDNGAILKLMISTDYTGAGSPAAASWVQLPANISSGHNSGYGNTWIPSGIIDLNAFSRKAYIAFLYEGADPSGSSNDKTTTFEIDDIIVYGD